MKRIKSAIELARRQLGDAATDGEVVVNLLADEALGLEAEHTEDLKVVSGVDRKLNYLLPKLLRYIGREPFESWRRGLHLEHAHHYEGMVHQAFIQGMDTVIDALEDLTGE